MVSINPLKVNPTSPLLHFRLVRSFVLIILFILLSFSMMGCVTMNDPEASQVYNSDSIATLDSKTVVGQSFVSRRPNFNGITIWITPLVTQETALNSSIQNTIDIKVFHSPDDAFPLYSTSVSTPMSGKNIPINIQIPNQGNPEEEKFFITLSTNSGSFQINGRNENAYPFGQVYIDNKPVNADIAYRSSYMYDFDALEEDINQGIKYAWLLIPLLIILWLPGWLLLEASGLRIRYDFGEQTALSVGISLSVIPILMLWTTIFNIKWTDEGVLFISILLVALWLARVIYINIRAKKNTYNNPSLEQPASPLHGNNHHLLISVILLLIFLTTLTIRMIMVRDLATPAWVDSVHHGLITQQIISLGAYPSSYAPYLDINPASYHPGFHSIAAAFTMLSKLKIDQSLLIIGQVINALTIFSVYLFTKVLTQSSLSGLFAAMITGFLTPMPAYYTSWGRYTELAGLLMLPVAFAFILILIERNATKQYYWIIFLCALVSGGLFLVHYRVAVFFGCLILSYFVIYMLITKKKPHKIIARGLLLIFIVVVAAIILVYPWMVQTITNTVYPIIKSTGMRTVPFFQDFSWAFLTAALGKLSLVLAGLGLIWGMLLQRRFSYLLLLWIVSLFLLANFDALRLPGGGLISNLSVEIMLFIPISVLGGFFIDQIINSWKDLVPQRLILLFIGSIVFLSLLVVYNGSKQLITILNPITILSRNADLPAIDWISKNIPEDETIVVNPFVWGYGLYAGSDGGYWISPLTGRLTLPPPVLYGLGSDRERINEEIQEVINISPNPMDLWEYLRTNRLHYIFIGEKGGVLSPEKLSSSDLFTIVYQNDGVWIFKTKP
jgi:hypothetical protein